MEPEVLAYGDVVEHYWQPRDRMGRRSGDLTYVAMVLNTDYQERPDHPVRIRPLFPMSQGGARCGDLRWATRWVSFKDLRRRIPDHEAEQLLGHPRPRNPRDEQEEDPHDD